MSQENDQAGVRRTGRYMQLLAWAGGIALLTVLFNDALKLKFNPNSQPQIQVAQDGTREVVLERNSQGHYVTSGTINGSPVVFLVDTGATDVAIPEPLANRLGLKRFGSGISQTANGAVAVWQTLLDEVSVGNIQRNRVRASIVPSMGDDSAVLLGMSFLKPLEFSQSNGRLILRQVPTG